MLLRYNIMELVLIFLIFVGLVLVILAFMAGKKIGEYRKERFWEGEIEKHRKDAVVRSRAVLSGQFSEQIAPYMPGFEFSPSECRFIGKPVDFVVFKGKDKKEIEEIVFVEVKTGNSKLSEQEKHLKRAVEDKKIRWKEYRM